MSTRKEVNNQLRKSSNSWRSDAYVFFFVSGTMSNVNYRQTSEIEENQRLIKWDANRGRERNGEEKNKGSNWRNGSSWCSLFGQQTSVLYNDNEFHCAHLLSFCTNFSPLLLLLPLSFRWFFISQSHDVCILLKLWTRFR